MKDRKTIIIKRYQNRKLYDTQNSTYVTLDDIGVMVRDGHDVRIIDNKTKSDLTSVTLTQIIFEEEKKTKSLLPLNVLKSIIRNGGDAIKDIVSKTTDSVQNTLSSAKEGAGSFYEKIGQAIESREDNIIKEVLEKTQQISKNIEGKIKDTVGSLAHVNNLQQEIRKLRQRVMFLEKKLRTYENR
ncbi:MAG: polyhydroxyalkanoate synthesis regulator DNA-binding domain-containing protein [Deltaproteobacteria bacterium]|nr:polyhydroxyalkanoate synthesis regulator DNA-binding domain-containing protein [Deltaproteobacteria bacterium]